MSLRIRLLLLSLLTLALPWAGCQYARKMENVVRGGQEAALLAAAQTMAQVVYADANAPQRSDEREHYAVRLITQPVLDGFADEWPIAYRALPDRPARNARDRVLRLGVYAGALHLFLSVRDAHVVPELAATDAGLATSHDRAVLLIETAVQADAEETSALRAWSISAVAPGPIIAHRAGAAPWLPKESIDSDIRGVWRPTADGYDVELRIPQRLVGDALALFSVDDADAAPPDIALAPLIQASEALNQRLQAYTPAGLRLGVVDSQGWLMARAGAVDQAIVSDADRENAPLDWRRLFLPHTEAAPPEYGLPYGMWGEPVDSARRGVRAAAWHREGGEDPSMVRAAVPVMRDGRVVGAVVVEQAAAQLAQQRDAAMRELVDFLAPVTALAMALSLAFGVWLSWRIRRLSKAAAVALSPDGRIEHRLPDARARDELGDLSRSYATLLQRLKDYTQYLQTLGSKLTHELRTPLAIVASSLENLSAEPSGAQAREYIERARDGAKRLQTTLSAMSEATRVEQSIEQAERVTFDLGALVRDMARAYQQTFAVHRIVARVPEEPCGMRGAPDLIAQMLDKLVDNAADFCPPGGLIDIELHVEPKLHRVIVRNEGPLLPVALADKLFDAMVAARPPERPDGQRPHLGLGLYIVQLVARFHRGRARAANLTDRSGVEFSVELPR